MREMRWDCERDGCFNIKHRLKLGVFDDCFPGAIGFGDVDAIVEINHRFLMLEWKSKRCKLPRGQSLLFQRMTAIAPVVVYVVFGDAESMAVSGYFRFWKGREFPYMESDLEALRSAFTGWAKFALEPHCVEINR